jgi:hypothetical protein
VWAVHGVHLLFVVSTQEDIHENTVKGSRPPAAKRTIENTQDNELRPRGAQKKQKTK